MPSFFFKRLKLDQLGKSRAFSKKALLFPENARLFRLKLRTLIFTVGAVSYYIICVLSGEEYQKNCKPQIAGSVVTNMTHAIVVALQFSCRLSSTGDMTAQRIIQRVVCFQLMGCLFKGTVQRDGSGRN